jgi:hypothetical protein
MSVLARIVHVGALARAREHTPTRPRTDQAAGEMRVYHIPRSAEYWAWMERRLVDFYTCLLADMSPIDADLTYPPRQVWSFSSVFDFYSVFANKLLVHTFTHIYTYIHTERERVTERVRESVCVCVSERERARARERERERERDARTHTHTHTHRHRQP